MGCDIHSYLERRTLDGWEMLPGPGPFGDRSYDRFAFLADVRNYSGIEPISMPRGLPVDASAGVLKEYDGGWDYYCMSWLTLDELDAYPYDDVEVYDVRRCETCTLREFLGEGFFEEIAEAREAGGDRVVFWFDS
jgi:hypothetical protein